MINRQIDKKYFYQTQPKIRWSLELNKWLCFDTKLIDHILSSDQFVVHNLDISSVEEKFKIDLDLSKQVLEKLPLAHEGDTHRHLRKKFINRINEKQANAITNFENDITNLWDFKNIHDEYDLIPGLHKAIIQFNAFVSGIDDFNQVSEIDTIGQIFDEHTPIRKRIAINEKFKLLYKLLSNKLNHEEKIYRISLFTVGINALLATLSESLIHSLKLQKAENNPYKYWEEILPTTGLVFVERVAQNDAIMEDVTIRKGDRVRCYIEMYTHTSDAFPGYLSRFFGFPSNHICPGMKASISLWQIVLNTLRKKNVGFQLKSYEYRTNDQLFNFPTSIKVKPI